MGGQVAVGQDWGLEWQPVTGGEWSGALWSGYGECHGVLQGGEFCQASRGRELGGASMSVVERASQGVVRGPECRLRLETLLVQHIMHWASSISYKDRFRFVCEVTQYLYIDKSI